LKEGGEQKEKRIPLKGTVGGYIEVGDEKRGPGPLWSHERQRNAIKTWLIYGTAGKGTALGGTGANKEINRKKKHESKCHKQSLRF